EMARESYADEEPSFEIEDEIVLDLPDDFGTPSTSAVVPPAPAPTVAAESIEIEAPTVYVEPTPAPEPVIEQPTIPAWGTTVAASLGAAGMTVAATSFAATEPSPAIELPPVAAPVEAPVEAPAAVAAEPPAPTVIEQPAPVTPEIIGRTEVSTPVSVPIDMRSHAPFAVAPKASAVPPAGEDPLLNINDDIDAQVLPIFLEEAQELFPAASAEIRTLRASPNDKANLDSLKRTLHTLKGSARMAGAMRLGELTHIVESAVAEKHGDWTSTDLDQVEERFDDVAFVLDALVAGKYDVVLPRFAVAQTTDEDTDLADEPVASVEASTAAVGAPAETGTKTPEVSVTAAAIAAAKAAIIPATATVTAATATAAAAEGAVSFLRVRTDSVELLADEAGEIAINRSRIESELRGLKTSLADLTTFVVRLRTLLREIEIQGESQIQSRLDQESTFDPLEFDRYTRFQELTRSLAEGVNDVGTVQQSLLRNIDDAETALAAQTRLSRSVQLRLQSLRTVPFSTVTERLYRVLRQTAKDVQKRANLDIAGGRIEIDRGVLERLIPVLEHLVRNSFAHGIEAPEVREAAGKAAIGEINIAVKQQGNEVAIEFSDDGAGIALERVRQRAIAAGLAQPDEPLNDAQLIEFIFRPGFTTSESVTAIAGRGVGMDVVRSELAALGGRVVAATSAGVGTRFTLSVPLTLAVTQVLLVEIAGTVYGIPSSLIDTVRQVPARERAVALAAKQFDVAGKFIPYRSMSVLLGGRPDGTVHKTYSVAFVRAGEAAAAVEVDKVIGNQEVVAKPYGPQLARVPGMA
ncbi:MAG: chemotaxis protein CheA, partial [Casimicrobium sp.]